MKFWQSDCLLVLFRGGRKSLAAFVPSCVFLAALNGGTVAFAAPSAKPSPTTVVQSSTATEPQAAQLPAVNDVTQAAVKAGVLTCVRRINQISQYLTSGSLSGALLFPSANRPDENIFSASFELQGQNPSPLYASASFSPKSSGECEAVYDAVEYLPLSCDEVHRSKFSSLKSQGAVRKDIIVLSAGALKVFLMHAGTGCVVIKKEIVQ